VLRSKNPRTASNLEKQIPCAQKKNPFSKDLKTQLLGEQNQHATTSLGIKSTKQTGLVFEIFSTNTFGN